MIIRITDLQKSFGDIKAVDGIDLSVAPGEMFGLLGPDGAGKTTTIRMLCTLLKPDAGECKIRNYDSVQDYRDIRSIIGYMPQRFSLYPDLTVAENLRFFADLFQVPRKKYEAKLAELLQFSHLGPFQHRRANALSGGMKQKLALSCTLIHTPELLLLDEPTTGVDPVSRREFWRILNALKAQGVTIFCSTPYMDEALHCDRVAFLHKGKILACDTPDRLIKLFPFPLLELWSEKIIHAVDVLKQNQAIRSIQVFGDKLHVALEDNRTGISAISRQLTVNGFENPRIRIITPTIEDTFIHLMGE